MRALHIDRWDAGPILMSFRVIGVLCLLALWWSTSVARGVIARR